MVPHKKPNPDIIYNIDQELASLINYKLNAPGRAIPSKSQYTLLAATWNLTNLGLQERLDSDYRLMAEIISWFDLIAVQEIAIDLSGFRKLMSYLPGYSSVVSDPGGNDERLGFIYNKDKVSLLEMVGEVAVPPSDHRYIRMKTVSGVFTGFDRNPYIAAFKSGNLEFVMVSVHLYYGGKAWYYKDRRTLETYAVARWGDLRRKSNISYSQNIIILGDFNLEKKDENDKVYKALKNRGMILPVHTSRTGSNLDGDQEYDQIGFFPGPMNSKFTNQSGVFDFDGGIFANAWNSLDENQFQDIIKYHIADHRPLWAEFSTD
jgi:exonuclease III